MATPPRGPNSGRRVPPHPYSTIRPGFNPFAQTNYGNPSARPESSRATRSSEHVLREATNRNELVRRVNQRHSIAHRAELNANRAAGIASANTMASQAAADPFWFRTPREVPQRPSLASRWSARYGYHLPPFDEPPTLRSPAGWRSHHEHFLFMCRGNVHQVTERMQAVFGFDPPVEEEFIAQALGGTHCIRQMSLVEAYLPGETHTIQRAMARGVLRESNLIHPDIAYGRQDIDVIQYEPGDDEYFEPVMPSGAPTRWGRNDDAYLLLYLGTHPDYFIIDYGWMFPDRVPIDFLRIRMAQLPYLNISASEVMQAVERVNEIRYMGAWINGGKISAFAARRGPLL